MVVTLAFLVGAVVASWSRLPDVEWRFQAGWLALSLVALLLFQWLHIEIWRGMLRDLGSTLEPWRGRAIWSTTLLARYVPTSVLMAVGRVALAEREGVPKRVGMASVLYEVALTFSTAVAISTYLVITLPDFSGRPERLLVLVVPLVGLALLHPRPFRWLGDAALRRVGREPMPAVLSFHRVLRFAILFALSFVVAGLAVYAMTRALHPIATRELPTAVASYSLGFAAGVVAFVIPGALGAREAGVVIALTVVVPATVALAVAVALRLLQMGVEVLYAAVTPLLARRVATSAG